MLAGGVAHEINNPLGGILAFTQLLKSEFAAESAAQEDLNEIEEAAKRCKKIVADLLTLSRPSTGLELSTQNLNEIIEKILPMLRLSLRESSILIKTDYAADLPQVVGEITRLQQVFLNLIKNAAEASRQGGEVIVRTRRSRDRNECVVEVQDSGEGIKEEDLSRIFDPFFTTKGHRGTGLGLSICDSIINDHRGRMEVESVYGKGSTFRVVLPGLKKEGGG